MELGRAPASDPDLALPLWTVVHAASTLLIDGPLDRVKGCASCRFHFLDESRNRSRRWCSMEDCGTPSRWTDTWRGVRPGGLQIAPHSPTDDGRPPLHEGAVAASAGLGVALGKPLAGFDPDPEPVLGRRQRAREPEVVDA